MEAEWLEQVLPDAIDHILEEGQDLQHQEGKTSSKDVKIKPENLELDISKIANVELVMIAGSEDSLCTPEDNMLLYKKIKETTEVPITLTYLQGLGHQDLIRGEDMSHFSELVLPAILKQTRTDVRVV